MINNLIIKDQLLNQKIIIKIKYQFVKMFKKNSSQLVERKEINMSVHSC